MTTLQRLLYGAGVVCICLALAAVVRSENSALNRAAPNEVAPIGVRKAVCPSGTAGRISCSRRP